MTPSAGGFGLAINALSGPILPLIRSLAAGFHKAVERIVDKAVDNFQISSKLRILYRFAPPLGTRYV